MKTEVINSQNSGRISTLRFLVSAMTRLPTPHPSAQDPTKSSTAPYPNLPKPWSIADPWPDCKRNPETIGPTTAEIPLTNDIAVHAEPMSSGLLPTHSTAACVQVDENPPLYR